MFPCSSMQQQNSVATQHGTLARACRSSASRCPSERECPAPEQSVRAWEAAHIWTYPMLCKSLCRGNADSLFNPKHPRNRTPKMGNLESCEIIYLLRGRLLLEEATPDISAAAQNVPGIGVPNGPREIRQRCGD